MDNLPSTYEAPRGRLLPTLVLFVFILGLFYTLFLVFSTFSLKRAVAGLEENKSTMQRKIEVLNDQQIQELFTAQQLTERLEENAVRWSQVLTSLQTLTPVGVFFSTYALSEDGTIQVNGYGESYASVADLISAMEKAETFVGPFVPSVTAGSTSDGRSIASFTLNIQLPSAE